MDRVPEFKIVNIENAERLLAADETRYLFRHVVSLGEPGSTPPRNLYESSFRRVLRLEFDDVTYRPFVEEGGYVRASRKQIESLIAFLTEVNEPILFHCAAGVSRSAAAAVIFACMKLGPGKEMEAMELVRLSRSIAHPNKHMLRLADDILGRNGKIIEASFSVWQENEGNKLAILQERGT